MDRRSRGSCWGKVGNVLCFPSFPQPFPTLRDPSPDCGEYVVPGWSGPTHYKAGIPAKFGDIADGTICRFTWDEHHFISLYKDKIHAHPLRFPNKCPVDILGISGNPCRRPCFRLILLVTVDLQPRESCSLA